MNIQKRFWIIYWLVGGIPAMSQNTADSIYTYQQSQTANTLYHQNLTQLVASGVTKVGMAELGWRQESGNFRWAQQAHKTTQTALRSEGIRQLNRVWLSGHFSVSQVLEDSLAWTQRGINEGEYTGQPYYNASAKAGPYNRIFYDLGGRLAYRLNNWLYVGSGITYTHWDATRSIDPRPRVSGFLLKYTPEIAVRTQKHWLGIGLIGGMGNEQNELQYKNEDYQKSLLYADRINYLIMGYGYLAIQQTNTDIERYRRLLGYRANYAGTLANWELKAGLDYTRSVENNKRAISESVQYRAIGDYIQKQYVANVVLFRQNPRGSSQLRINGNVVKGHDVNSTLQGTSYFFKNQLVTLAYEAQQKISENRHREWGATFQHYRLVKRDLASAHHYETQWVVPEIWGALHFDRPNRNRLAVRLGTSYRASLANTLTVPETQENAFTRGVVYPDFIYSGSNVLTGNVQLNYVISKFLKQYRAGIGLRGQGLYASQQPVTSWKADFIPGNNRYSASIDFTLYL